MRPRHPPHRPHQRGAIAVLFTLMVILMLAMLGLALDLSLVYNRKAELQALADATALAAARELNGTPTGLSNAVTAAATTAATFRYQYNNLAVSWSPGALRFASTADAAETAWTDAGGATPASTWFAKVDTRQLDINPGIVATVFMRISDSAPRTVSTAARAVAGRLSVQVLPLAICAQSATPAASRANVPGNSSYNELVEFGFRRGVAYDLMNLNPNGVAPENFVIDPLAPPGTPGSPAHFALDVVGPFVCAGSMPMSSVTGGAITLQRGFPLASLYSHLNSRFDDYSGNRCAFEGAPPDSNTMSFSYATIPWMTAKPSVQSAASWTSGSKLWTRADPLPGDASNTALLYGPLWAYAKAVPYSAYSATDAEPAAGYSTYAVSNWSNLYTPNPPTAKSYPAAQTTATPYNQTTSTYFLAPPSHPPGLAKRRVLNVALLNCPVPAGATATATVAGIARFFMTVPATASSLSAEFAGIAPPASLGGPVELQP